MNNIVFDDYDHKVVIEGQILDRMFQYRQTGILRKEAGGVLIGREIVVTGNLIIERITEPQDLDKQSRFRFERKDLSHMKYFEELYKISDKTYGYFGEWHTHPEKVPNYSGTDKRNWMKLYEGLPQKHALYFIIVGIFSVGVWKLDLSESKQPIRVFLSEWNSLQTKEIYEEEYVEE